MNTMPDFSSGGGSYVSGGGPNETLTELGAMGDKAIRLTAPGFFTETALESVNKMVTSGSLPVWGWFLAIFLLVVLVLVFWSTFGYAWKANGYKLYIGDRRFPSFKKDDGFMGAAGPNLVRQDASTISGLGNLAASSDNMTTRGGPPIFNDAPDYLRRKEARMAEAIRAYAKLKSMGQTTKNWKSFWADWQASKNYHGGQMRDGKYVHGKYGDYQAMYDAGPAVTVTSGAAATLTPEEQQARNQALAASSVDAELAAAADGYTVSPGVVQNPGQSRFLASRVN